MAVGALMTVIPFAEWRPDEDIFMGGSSATILNVLPGPNCYYPWPQLSIKTNAVPAKTYGAVFAVTEAGFAAFAGTADALYKLNAATGVWEDVSGSSTYAANEFAPWRFAVFNGAVIAVNRTTPTQTFTVGSSSAFADLANAPQAAQVAVWGRHLVLGDTDDGVSHPNRVHGSDIDDPTVWAPSSTNNAFLQDFADGGEVRGLSSSNNAIIVQANAIRRATLVGRPQKVVFNRLTENFGTLYPASVADYEGSLFFYSSGGFVRVSQTGEISFIGQSRVDEWFRDNSAGTNNDRRVAAAADTQRRRVYWAFHTTEAAEDYDCIICYDIANNRWSISGQSVSELIPFAFEGSSADDLTATSIDSINYTFDFEDSAPVIGALNTSRQAGSFSGDANRVELYTTELPKELGKRMRINASCPIVDASDSSQVFVRVMKRENRNEEFVETASSGVERTGWVPHRHTGRNFILQLRIARDAAWTKASGIQIDMQEEGGQ